MMGTTNNMVIEKGDFVLVFLIQKARDHSFPEEGGWSDEFEEGIAKHQSTFEKLFGQYFITR